METLSDLDLINNIKQNINEEDSLKELIHRHSGVYLSMVNSFLRNIDNDSIKQDIVAEKDSVIYNSAIKFDNTKGAKFSTHVGNEAKWICLTATNKNKKYVELHDNQIDFYEMEEHKEQSSDKLNSQIINSFFDYVDSCEDKRISKIFRMRYLSSDKITPWKKISEAMNLSIQGCINIHNNALKILSKKVISKYEINT